MQPPYNQVDTYPCTLLYGTERCQLYGHLRLIDGPEQHEEVVRGCVGHEDKVVGRVAVVAGHAQGHHALQERLHGACRRRFTAQVCAARHAPTNLPIPLAMIDVTINRCYCCRLQFKYGHRRHKFWLLIRLTV